MDPRARITALPLVAVTLLACSAEENAAPEAEDGLIPESLLHTAWDGEHVYQVVLTVSPELIDAASAVWEVDREYVRSTPFEEIAGAMLLTTKRSGDTFVRVHANTPDGRVLTDEVGLMIAKASAPQWQVGEARFNLGQPIRPPDPNRFDGPACGLEESQLDILPDAPTCTTCHAPLREYRGSPLAYVVTPLQTAKLDNRQLLDVVTQGVRPEGDSMQSWWLKTLPEPACVFELLHKYDVGDESDAQGLVWKLRSRAPELADPPRSLTGQSAAGAPAP